jgi:hypothetical protein
MKVVMFSPVSGHYYKFAIKTRIIGNVMNNFIFYFKAPGQEPTHARHKLGNVR